jgi:CYTH domain-containing protein
METLAFPQLVAMQLTCTQQYLSGERIHVTIRPRLLGNHATLQYRVVSVSMEVFNFRLPSNDRCV